MYPKNNATPPAIDLGQILLLADGTIQTTGASVRVKIGTGAWGAGAGTLACDTTSGIWTYAPTQAETNAEYFIVAAYKADCSALSKTVITSDSSVSGRVNVQTLQTDVITAAAFATSAVDEIVDAVYDEPMSGHTVNGSYGSHLVRSANQNQNTVQITGSQHIAADVHEFQPGVITSGDFAAGAITSTVLATDSITSSQIAASAVTEIQAGLATSSGVTSAFTEIKGAGWSSSTDTLEKIRDASGGSNITITPLSSTVEDRVNETTIRVFLGENITVGPIAVFDSTGGSVDLSATCEIVISRKYRGDILIIPNGSISRSGVNNNQFSFSSTGATLIPGTHSWALRRVSDNFVFAHGDWIVKQVATKD